MQGFNMGRYVPPDVEGTTTGNKLHNKHALGSRASKLRNSSRGGGGGGLTVRFEMPYAIWCASCPKPTIIGQGVRFNAEKRRAGNYHSTPIWSFRFRHAACGGAIEMRTDPANTAYVVISGATKRDTGEEEADKSMEIQTAEEREKLRSSAFASLEKTIEDRQRLREATERIDELQHVARRQWDDPYTLNQKLRRSFRAARKGRETAEEKTEEVRERMGLGIELLPESEADARRAAVVDFGEDERGAGAGAGADAALAMPLFGNSRNDSDNDKSGKGLSKSLLKADRQREKEKQAFMTQVMGNTRASRDPFLRQRTREDGSKGPTKVTGLKRKRDANVQAQKYDGKEVKDEPPSKVPGAGHQGSGLVAYDSDSD